VPTTPTNISLIPPLNETGSFYDDLVYLHMDLNMRIHFTGLFLPWHRYFVHYFENALKKRCGYKGVTPYWDWTIDAHDMFNSAFFDNSTYQGVGGWGDPNNDFQIYTGGFKDQIRTYPSLHHIRRNFSLYPFDNPNAVKPFPNDPNAPPLPVGFAVNGSMTKANETFAVNGFEGDFITFQAFVEQTSTLHGGIHLILGADMTGYCPANAPPDCIPGAKWTTNDPLFFLHHGMVDKIWNEWQEASPLNKYAFGGGSVAVADTFLNFETFPNGLPPFLGFDSELPGDGLWNNVTIWDVMDITGDTLCYIYA